MVAFYMLAQFLGTLIGALLAWILTKSGGDLYIANGGEVKYDILGKYWFEAILVETFMTTIFVIVFLAQQRK